MDPRGKDEKFHMWRRRVLSQAEKLDIPFKPAHVKTIRQVLEVESEVDRFLKVLQVEPEVIEVTPTKPTTSEYIFTPSDNPRDILSALRYAAELAKDSKINQIVELPKNHTMIYYANILSQLTTPHVIKGVMQIASTYDERPFTRHSLDALYQSDTGSDMNEDILLMGTVMLKPPFEFRKKLKAKHTGDGFSEDIMEYIDEQIYIPSGTACFYKCLKAAGCDTGILASYIEKYCRTSKFSTNNLGQLISYIGRNVLVMRWRDKEAKWRALPKVDDITLFLVNKDGELLRDSEKTSGELHYVLWRNNKLPIPNANKWNLKEHITLVNRELTPESLNKVVTYTKPVNKFRGNIRVMTFAWDCETYGQGEEMATPYACAYINTAVIRPNIPESNISKCVKFFHGTSCIDEMIDSLQHATGDVGNIDKIIYAHNSAKFDTFIALTNCKTVKWQKHIKTGRGLISLSTKRVNGIRVIFRDTLCHISGSLRSLCTEFRVPDNFCKKEMEHDELTALNYIEKMPIWKPYLLNDVVGLGYIVMAVTNNYRELGVPDGINQYLTSSSMAWGKYLTEGGRVEALDNPEAKKFVAQSIWGGRVYCLKKLYKAPTWEAILEGEQPIINDFMVAFDANSLYPSAQYLNKMPVGKARYLNASQCEFELKESTYAIMEVTIVPPKNMFTPILPRRLPDGSLQYDVNTRTDVYGTPELRQCLELGYVITQYHKGITWDNCDDSFKLYIGKLYDARKLAIEEGNDIKAGAIKTILVSVYGKTVQRDIMSKQKIVTREKALKTFSTAVIPNKCIELVNEQVVLELKQENSVNKSMPRQVGSAILSYSKVIMNKFLVAIDGLNSVENAPYYGDTDSIYIRSDQMNALSEAGCVGKELGQGKSDYGDDLKIVYGIFLASKVKLCVCINNRYQLFTKVTWKGRNISPESPAHAISARTKNPLPNSLEYVKMLIAEYERFGNTNECMFDKHTWDRSIESGIHIDVVRKTSLFRTVHRNELSGIYYPKGYII